jgi:hypothetical protein
MLLITDLYKFTPAFASVHQSYNMKIVEYLRTDQTSYYNGWHSCLIFLDQRPAMRNAYKVLVRKHVGRALGRPGHRWEDNITTDVREIGWEDVAWIHLTQIRHQWWALVNTVMNLLVL